MNIYQHSQIQQQLCKIQTFVKDPNPPQAIPKYTKVLTWCLICLRYGVQTIKIAVL